MADELLRALGNRQAEPPEESSEEARALLRPFEGTERAELLDAVLEGIDRAQAPAPDDEPEPRAVVELQSKRRGRTAWVGVVTAMAAGMLLWLGVRRPTTPGETLPPYEVTRLSGGVASVRASEVEVPSSVALATDASVDWILTPKAPVRSPVGAVLLATAPGRPSVLARTEALEVSAEGVVRISGRLSEILPLPPGTWTVTALVGAPDALPRTAAEAEAKADDGGTWSLVSFEVKIIAAP